MSVKNIADYDGKQYDICIIGSGPAGMTLCAELSKSGLSIAVLESGGLKKNPIVDKLRQTESTGEIKIKENSRERIIGGTSSTWAGLSSPLDPIDFKTWPITLTELEPYYERMSTYGFASFNRFRGDSMESLRKKGEINLISDKITEKIFIASDPPWNFGKKLSHIFNIQGVDLFAGTTVIFLENRNGTVLAANVEDFSENATKKTTKFSARVFVLAAGGIESTRLLLLSKNLGNEYDQVGRYIMNHPKGNFGYIELKKPVTNLPHLFGYLKNGWAEYAGLRLTDDVQNSKKILNSYIRLEPIFPWTDSKSVAGFISIIKQAKYFLNWWKRRQKTVVNLRDWNETGDDRPQTRISKDLLAILKGLPSLSIYIFYRLLDKKTVPINRIRLRNFMEMEPRAENRIILSKTLDSNGLPIPRIKLDCSARDKQSVMELHRILGEEIKKRELGELKSDFNPLKSSSKVWPIVDEASHHLGGTRMGNNPKNSVVDKNLKVHSISNLYIASGSVFPTSGCANPTYTICALSARLADHILEITSSWQGRTYYREDLLAQTNVQEASPLRN